MYLAYAGLVLDSCCSTSWVSWLAHKRFGLWLKESNLLMDTDGLLAAIDGYYSFGWHREITIISSG